MQGRKPKRPRVVRLKTGKYEADTVAQPVRLWPVPKHLGDVGRNFYKTVGHKLLYLGILADTDKASFVNLALLHQRLVEAEQAITDYGMVVPDRNGSFKKNPACAVAKSLHTLFRASAEDFGLTPRSRARLGIKTVPPKAPRGLLSRSAYFDDDDDLLT
jgi:P27 family predicted phage terminase small subunit